MTNKMPIKQMMGEIFYQIADAIETGQLGKKVKVGLTTFGCEVGIDQWIAAAEAVSMHREDFEVVLIGQKMKTSLLQFEASSEDEAHRKMETMLDFGMIDACITTHYSYPIGVASVGKIMVPGKGKDLFLATTSGTAALNRSAAMVMNALYGIITAKTMGIALPKVGILNVAGARKTEKALRTLVQQGYDIRFAVSLRPESRCIMRGNDVVAGTPDVLVHDSLTGNITMKMLATFLTGGTFESIGAGYGPGIGLRYDRLAMVISRASGYSVVQEAILYAVQLIKGNLLKVAQQEFSMAKNAGLEQVIQGLMMEGDVGLNKEMQQVVAPLGEPVNQGISGIDIMELEKAMKIVWREGIYAESGMGCTGPILMVSDTKLALALDVLKRKGYLVYEEIECV